MKIGFTGLALPEGKVKFEDSRVDQLVEKAQPKKVSSFYVELAADELVRCEAIVTAKTTLLDVLIQDIEKCESRIERSESEAEKELMKRCIAELEAEHPLCDVTLTDSERTSIAALSPVSLKPVVSVDESVSVNAIIEQVLAKAGTVFFFTSGPKEVHAWPIQKDSDIVTCAGKIHTDLARGFIKADIVPFNDFIQCHNFNDCKKKGVVKVVERDYRIVDGDVIEIRFNV
ncbi:MAG: DUF933 domain-containing protein [Chitinivibrionales bacterium]|nr:DUF933 domain-containing protein [Chitinivibrionales bacterium]